MPILYYKEIPLSYTIKGQGEPLVLLHGYLESKEIWNNVVNPLAQKYTVITIDIPGHGQSGILSEVHTMELMADVVNFIIEKFAFNKVKLLGHSMGGYIALAFANKYQHKLSLIGLVHSVSSFDTPEKIKNRNREIDLIKKGKFDLICETSLPNVFAKDNLKKFSNELEIVKERTKLFDPNGVISLIKGMQVRKDNIDFFKNLSLPKIIIKGVKDNFIPFSEMDPRDPEDATIYTFKNSGHISFIEEQNKFIKIILEI